MEISGSVVSKIDISTMRDTRRSRALTTVKVIIFLNGRRLGIEVVWSPGNIKS
jgi:hypothetical protein